MPNALVTGPFVAMEAIIQLSYELEGLKPMVMKRGRSTAALYVDVELPSFVDSQPAEIATALRPATQVLAKAIKRNHIKRFYRGELPRAGFEMAHQVVTCGIAMTFLRFFDIRKRQMINRLQVLGAVRH